MSKKLTAKDFISKASTVHAQKYDYSKVIYIDRNTEVCIICPIHGEFWQKPGNHLGGSGCYSCKAEKLSLLKRKWTDEEIVEISKNYKDIKDFYTNNIGCYRCAIKRGLLNKMTWLSKRYKEINRDTVIKESKKYGCRGDFCNYSHSHYIYALKHNMLDEMTWLKPKTNAHTDAHCIYVYIDEENKAAYIGQSLRPEDRDKEHRSNTKSTVYKYFVQIGKSVPKPIYLESNLQDKQAQIRENYWVNYYKCLGYKILNKAKTGLYCSSLGLCPTKWTKDRTFREARKCSSSGDFRKNNESAYQIACRKGWIVEFAEELGWKLRIKWNHKTCFYYASKCHNKTDFKNKYQTGYKYARIHKLLNKIPWDIQE